VRHIFERVVMAATVMGLVKGEGFALDGSVIEANASRYHGKAPTSSIGRGSSVRSAPPLAVRRCSPDRNRDGLARYGRAGDTLDRGRHRRRTDGSPPEAVRVCLGGPPDRAVVRSALEFMAHALAESRTLPSTFL
jgi:hypothetical protein